VTGAKEFARTNLVGFFKAGGVDVVEASSRTISDCTALHLDFRCGSGWKNVLCGVDVVVVLAGRGHVILDSSQNLLDSFREINVDGTLRNAEIAAAAGVKRFVFISSIKALGDSTLREAPFVIDQKGTPVDPYGISKVEPENALMARYQESGLMDCGDSTSPDLWERCKRQFGNASKARETEGSIALGIDL